MAFLVFPEKVVLRMVDSHGASVPVRNVLFRVHTFAKHKNDFNLGPFMSGPEGVVMFTKAELSAEAKAHYDTGVMDYRAVEDCDPEVEIHAMTPEQVVNALHARTTVWKSLLKGETERWTNIEELRSAYRNAANDRVTVRPLRAKWDGSQREVDYAMVAAIR